jgi:hypothetical protein
MANGTIHNTCITIAAVVLCLALHAAIMHCPFTFVNLLTSEYARHASTVEATGAQCCVLRIPCLGKLAHNAWLLEATPQNQAASAQTYVLVQYVLYCNTYRYYGSSSLPF